MDFKWIEFLLKWILNRLDRRKLDWIKKI